MLNLKSRKGEIATLLTLGLVLVGTLITLGTSLFVNKTKNIASNPRASVVNCIYNTNNICKPECTYSAYDCLKCKNNKYRCQGTTDDSPSVPTTKIEPTTRAPTSAVTYKCCKVYETSSTCGGRKRIQNMGNGYSTTCSANSLVDCSSVGGPTTSRASICPEGSAATPPAAGTTTCVIGKKCGSGNYWDCTTANGCNPSICKTPSLDFACCVKDDHCPGEPRWRWYGCTGQPCENTKINNAYGHLFACPAGVDSTTNPETGVCDSQLTPAPTSSSAPTTPVGNSCEGDGKGVCVEKLFNNNAQNCNDYNPGSQPLSRSCGESSKLVCCSNPDYTPPVATKTPTPTISRNRTGRAGELCIVKQVEPGEPAYVYSCINPGYVCVPPNSSGICVSPTPQAGTAPDETSGPGAPAEPAVPVPPTPTLNPSGECNDLLCSSPNNSFYYSKKCWNPIYINNQPSCGGTWSYFRDKGCKDGYQTGSESEAKSSCGIVPRPIHITVKFVISNLNIEPTKPYLYLTVSNDVIPSIVNKTYNLSEGGNFTPSDEFDIEASPQGLKFYVWYNPAGVDWRNSVSSNITIKDGEAEVTITLK